MSRQIATQTHQQKPSVTISPGSKMARLGLQTKLRVNEPGDIYEQEADRIADRVMARPAHSKVSGAPQGILRLAGQLARQLNLTPASVDQALADPGRPLEPTLRQDMEQRFGHDFSGVRVHTDADAEQSVRDVNAHAYTVGHDVVFGAGRFAPGTQDGRRLLAHELAHVVQQSSVNGINFCQDDDEHALFPICSNNGVKNIEDTPLFGLRQEQALFSLQRTIGNRAIASAVPIELDQYFNRNRVFTSLPFRDNAEPPIEISLPLRHVGPNIKGHIKQQKASGSPLPQSLRLALEDCVGLGLSRVRVHAGLAAQQLTRRFGAKGFTVGQDIYLDPQVTNEPAVFFHEVRHAAEDDPYQLKFWRDLPSVIQRIRRAIDPTAMSPPADYGELHSVMRILIETVGRNEWGEMDEFFAMYGGAAEVNEQSIQAGGEQFLDDLAICLSRMEQEDRLGNMRGEYLFGDFREQLNIEHYEWGQRARVASRYENAVRQRRIDLLLDDWKRYWQRHSVGGSPYRNALRTLLTNHWDEFYGCGSSLGQHACDLGWGMDSRRTPHLYDLWYQSLDVVDPRLNEDQQTSAARQSVGDDGFWAEHERRLISALANLYDDALIAETNAANPDPLATDARTSAVGRLRSDLPKWNALKNNLPVNDRNRINGINSCLPSWEQNEHAERDDLQNAGIAQATVMTGGTGRTAVGAPEPGACLSLCGVAAPAPRAYRPMSTLLRILGF